MKIKSLFIVAIIYFLNLNNVYSLEADIFVQSTVNRASKSIIRRFIKRKKDK